MVNVYEKVEIPVVTDAVAHEPRLNLLEDVDNGLIKGKGGCVKRSQFVHVTAIEVWLEGVRSQNKPLVGNACCCVGVVCIVDLVSSVIRIESAFTPLSRDNCRRAWAKRRAHIR